ncbi:hypothetical protein Ciccas_001691 [Cichlidogyrus casuarinus]|uniref:Cadherin domain-containing protein n=1 Tax=Cichlidogyrus casuarinus TaxID=1844966 RepID=A0ABD2QJB7_9PLAT
MDKTAFNIKLIDDHTGQTCVLGGLHLVDTVGAEVMIIQAGNAFANYFEIDAQSMVVKTRKSVNREILCSKSAASKETYETACCLQAMRECLLKFTSIIKPKGSPEHFVNFHIKLMDVNDNRPAFPSDVTKILVPENRQVGSLIPIPKAKDADSNFFGVKRYRLEHDNHDTFKLVQSELGDREQIPLSTDDGTSEVEIYLKLQKPLDRERIKEYRFNLVAEDGGTPPLSGSTQILIQVLDVNDNHPKFVQSIYQIKISELTPVGEKIAQLRATDPDEKEFGTVVYEIDVQGRKKQEWNEPEATVANVASKFFRIDPKSGWLSIIAPLNYESQHNRFSFKVNARDMGGDSGYDQAIVKIQVLDENDEAPHIELESLLSPKSEDESNLLGGKIKSFLALPNNVYRWHIEEGLSTEMRPNAFAIIAVSDRDLEEGGIVKCSLCSVADKFQLTQATSECATNLKSSVFGLNEIPGTSQYALSLLQPLDFERSQLERVHIFCHDLGSPRLNSSKLVEVVVVDLNDHAPAFNRSLYQYSLKENEKAYTVLDHITAADADQGGNAPISYSLSAEGMQYFQIGANDGVFSTRTSFDREERDYYKFLVYAKDAGPPIEHTATATVEVIILDSNDHEPTFVGLNDDGAYHFQVMENLPANTHIGTLQARDEDGPKNSLVIYRLLGVSREFSLNPETGELSTSVELDRELKSNHILNAIASDNGHISRSSSVKVVIDVLDMNDHDPIVVFPTNGSGSVSISYKEPQGELTLQGPFVTSPYFILQLIAKIEARDADEGPNAMLHYLFAREQHSHLKAFELFYLEELTGELRVNKDMIAEDIGTYPISVLVQDSGATSRSTTVNFKVIVSFLLICQFDDPVLQINKQTGNP